MVDCVDQSRMCPRFSVAWLCRPRPIPSFFNVVSACNIEQLGMALGTKLLCSYHHITSRGTCTEDCVPLFQGKLLRTCVFVDVVGTIHSLQVFLLLFIVY